MINIIDKVNCCGCSACVSICPKQCILMSADDEGFLYPLVNKENCIDCGLCEKVCIELHPYDSRVPIKVLAAINKNEEVRLKSSSGGIFYLFAEKIINEGGVVFGARFDENWQVVIDFADTIEGIKVFMGSKYVQARIDTAYVDVKKFLNEGRKVLFSGTPCQVAGLYKFLKKKYDNLLSIDFICHGTPSPKVWAMYLNNILDGFKRTKTIQFRDDNRKYLHFWKKYDESEKAVLLLGSSDKNPYMKAFLSDLILRPSCFACKAKSCSSQSDITLADFWGVWNVNPKMYDDKGTSMLFINTEKGLNELPSEEYVKYANANYEEAEKYNKACIFSAVPNPKRTIFFEHLQRTKNVVKLINKILAPSIVRQYVRFIKSIFKKLQENQHKQRNLSVDSRININIDEPEISEIIFRNKNNGWKNYQMSIKIKNKEK